VEADWRKEVSLWWEGFVKQVESERVMVEESGEST